MKIVRLVLLLSMVGVPAACTGPNLTEPDAPATVSPTPLFNGSSPADTTSRDGAGPIVGSGT